MWYCFWKTIMFPVQNKFHKIKSAGVDLFAGHYALGFVFVVDLYRYHTILQNIDLKWLLAAPPPIIFEQQNLHQQPIYPWKENLTMSFKYWRNILVSPIYEEFS